MEDSAIGRRIVVYGVTGSGKTTLSRRLGAMLDLGVVEMDAIRHDGDWDATPWDEMRARVIAALDGHEGGWVCEGNYRRVRDVVTARADTVIWLRLPWRVSFVRLLRRTIARAWTGERLYAPHGPRETVWDSFFTRRSILWWSIHHHRAGTRSVAQAIAELEGRIPVHVLRTPAEVDGMLEAIAVARATRRDRIAGCSGLGSRQSSGHPVTSPEGRANSTRDLQRAAVAVDDSGG